MATYFLRFVCYMPRKRVYPPLIYGSKIMLSPGVAVKDGERLLFVTTGICTNIVFCGLTCRPGFATVAAQNFETYYSFPLLCKCTVYTDRD